MQLNFVGIMDFAEIRKIANLVPLRNFQCRTPVAMVLGSNPGAFLESQITFKKFFFFLTATWLFHSHLWVNVEGTASLTRRSSLHIDTCLT